MKHDPKDLERDEMTAPPPSGVLGGATQSRIAKTPRTANLSSDLCEDEGYAAQALSRNRRRHPRPARSTSNSSIIFPSLSRISLDDNATTPTTTSASTSQIRSAPRTFPRRASSSAMENRKSVVPSISEIIRNYRRRRAAPARACPRALSLYRSK